MTIKRKSTYLKVRYKAGMLKGNIVDVNKTENGWISEINGKRYYNFISHLRNDEYVEILEQH